MPITRREYTALTRNLPDALAHSWIFQCDKPECIWRTAHVDEATALHTQSIHTCPNKGEKRMSKTLIDKLWDLLDEATVTILEWPTADETQNTDTDREKARGEARGIAKCIHVMCVPYYETDGDVVKQALKRYKMANGTIEFEDTPGTAGYNPAPAGTAPVHPRKGAPAAKAAQPELDPKRLAGLKRGIEAGFPSAALAKSYGVSVDFVDGLAIKPSV